MSRPAGPSNAPITTHVARYIAEAAGRDVPSELLDRTKMHILDAFIAIISGSTLPPGLLAAKFAGSRATEGAATVIGPGFRTHPELAALANGTAAHADETDDGTDMARMHTGASVIPASFAAGEVRDSSGSEFLQAVVAGYDVGVAMNLSVWEPGRPLRQSKQLTHGIGQLFGAAASAAVLAGLSVLENRYLLSYTSQRASGLTSAFRDSEHVEKAFSMGGKQAHDAVSTVDMMEAGFTGVDDIFDRSPTLFDVWGTGGDPQRLYALLDGEAHQIVNCDMKCYPVGMPIQAAAQALDELLAAESFTAEDVALLRCRLPAEKASIVDSVPIPDINCQYVLAVMLLDGGLTFDAAHDYARLRAPETVKQMDKVVLVHDESLDAQEYANGSTRRAVLELEMSDGRQLTHTVDPPRGNSRDPMTWDSMVVKAQSVLGRCMPAGRIEELVAVARNLQDVRSVRELRPLLATH